MAKSIEMPVVYVTATEMQNNFSKYLKIVDTGKDVIVTKNNKEVARMASSKKMPPTLLDFVGILSDMPHMSTKDIREERLKRYEATGRY